MAPAFFLFLQPKIPGKQRAPNQHKFTTQYALDLPYLWHPPVYNMSSNQTSKNDSDNDKDAMNVADFLLASVPGVDEVTLTSPIPQ